MPERPGKNSFGRPPDNQEAVMPSRTRPRARYPVPARHLTAGWESRVVGILGSPDDASAVSRGTARRRDVPGRWIRTSDHFVTRSANVPGAMRDPSQAGGYHAQTLPRLRVTTAPIATDRNPENGCRSFTAGNCSPPFRMTLTVAGRWA